MPSVTRLVASISYVRHNRGELPRRKEHVAEQQACIYCAKVYSLLDQKNITAWLELRNKAAHGEYEKYVAQQVEPIRIRLAAAEAPLADALGSGLSSGAKSIPRHQTCLKLAAGAVSRA
jgi:glutaredoxin